MGLRVDRESALGWLGIEGYRPSGRVRSVMQRPASDIEGETQAESADEPVRAALGSATEAVEIGEVPASDQHATTAAVPQAEGPAEAVSAEPAATGQPPADGLAVTADSPHRPLAEAIARVAGLAITSATADDCLWIGGERWQLATLAGDGQAKRRLWQALVARTRRPRA